jgi:hypothetical protein
MPFVSRKEINEESQGVIPRSSTKPVKPNKLTNRQLREKEFLSLLRKLKPLVAESIKTAANIMKDDDASHQNQLKAAVLILQNYKDMVSETYAVGYDEEAGEEIQQQNAPVFSLKMVNTD